MREHIILEKAKRYSAPDGVTAPDGCLYKAHEGFWVEKGTNAPMMRSDNPRKPISKKCDIETGEDQKGE